MKIHLIILPLLLLLTSCSTLNKSPTISDPPPAPTVTVSTNPQLTLLEESTRFNIFSQLHTNISLSVNYSNALPVIDSALTNMNSSAMLVREQLEVQEPIVVNTLVDQWNFLAYYATNQDNFINGLTAIRKGIVEALNP